MPQDKYFGVDVQLSDPANEARVLTPNDGTPGVISEPPRSIYVGSGGDITMQGMDDNAPKLWKNVPAGSILPFRVKKIMATGTTATNLLGLY